MNFTCIYVRRYPTRGLVKVMFRNYADTVRISMDFRSCDEGWNSIPHFFKDGDYSLLKGKWAPVMTTEKVKP